MNQKPKQEKEPKPKRIAQLILNFYDDGVIAHDCLEIIRTKRLGTKRPSVSKEALQDILKVNNIIFNLDTALIGTKSITDIISTEE